MKKIGDIVDNFARTKALLLLARDKQEKKYLEDKLSSIIATDQTILNTENHVFDKLVEVHTLREKIVRHLNTIKMEDNQESKLVSCAPPQLMFAKRKYHDSDYRGALDAVSVIVKNYNINTKHPTQEQLEVYLFYIMSASPIDADYSKYFDFISQIINNVDTIELNVEFKKYLMREYALYCLRRKRYDLAASYIFTMNTVSCPPLNINPKTIGFFKKDDIGKTLLIYWGGGKGDVIMHARFIPIVCEKYNLNNIIFMSESSITWIFQKAFNHIPNLKIISYDSKSDIMSDSFDYHININAIMSYLDYTYYQIPFSPYLKSFVKSIEKPIRNNRVGIINWHGGYNNAQEPLRGMPLEEAIPLLKIKNIKWQCITLDITPYEESILKKHNVEILKNIDKKKSFEDSMKYIAQSDLFVTTDTSLAHIAGTLDITDTYIILTQNYDWRWEVYGKDKEYTSWYPNVKLHFKRTNTWNVCIKNLVKKLT